MNHIMSSLYDKYHSDHNQTYMYNLIKDMIFKENQIDVSNNDTYNQFFKTNFVNTFKTVNTEDIRDLNNHLLTTQIDYFQNFISKKENLTQLNKETKTDHLIYSLQRNINLKNSSRLNFRIKTPQKSRVLQVEKVIIPIEDSSLFMGPTIILSIDTTYIELHLRGTMNLRGREYGICTPYYEQPFTLTSDVCRIQFKNQLFNVRKDCDVYKIVESNNKKISLSCSTNEFKEGDYIRICNFESKELDDDSILNQQYKIVGIRNNETYIELKLNREVKDCQGLFVMNLSLQNTIHLINP